MGSMRLTPTSAEKDGARGNFELKKNTLKLRVHDQKLTAQAHQIRNIRMAQKEMLNN